jgi:peptide/nickel transport system permease protein
MSRFRPATVVAATLLGTLAALSLAAPLIGAALGQDPISVDLLNRFQGPSYDHLLGTDDLGRDVLMRLLYGGRVSLAVGLTAAVCAASVGTAIGLAAGYFRGRVDAVLMRLTDSIIALPVLALLIVLSAIDLSKIGVPPDIASSDQISLWRIVIIIALVGWTTVARLVRATTLSLLARDFVRAARALGANDLRVMSVHILPNALTPIIVATTLAVGNVILYESVLSFLGLGIQPPIASWGNMLTNAQEMMDAAPALAVWPGLLILATVASCNLLGDALQDALNPRKH